MAPSAELSEDMLDMWTPKLDSTISRLGYGIDRRDCEMITTAGSTTILGRDFSESDLHLKRLITCKVHERPFAYARERERATKVAQMITAWCPKLFKPAYSALERTTSGWTANYPSTDSVLLVNGEALEGVFSRSAATIYLGTLEQWEQGFRPDCSKFAARPRDAYNYD
jgi:hypothetical protein